MRTKEEDGGGCSGCVCVCVGGWRVEPAEWKGEGGSGGLGEPGRSSGDGRMSEEADGRSCGDVRLAALFALQRGRKWKVCLRAARGSREEECDRRRVGVLPCHPVAPGHPLAASSCDPPRRQRQPPPIKPRLACVRSRERVHNIYICVCVCIFIYVFSAPLSPLFKSNYPSWSTLCLFTSEVTATQDFNYRPAL